MVIWLIGMSASGKTTIGKKLYDRLLLSTEKWIFLDGDTFRNILGEDLGHTIADRRKNAYRISRFCEFLSFQGINVLACVLSIFHDNQQYNKEHIVDYKEVYIDVDFDELVRRDNKELYHKALKGEIKDVVGVDIEFKPPYSPDLVIDNNKKHPDFELMIDKIVQEFNIVIENRYEYTKNNLLHHPHKYQYSKFEGESFFDKYIYDRKDALRFFKERLVFSEKVNIKRYELKYSQHKVDGELILKDFLIFLLNREGELEKEKEVILLLIKRFEVGKKLYLTYDLKEIRKSSLEFKRFINYPLFSLVLQQYYKNENSKEQKLIYLNVILKVNDIISSIREEITIPIEIDYSIKALTSELEITRIYI